MGKEADQARTFPIRKADFAINQEAAIGDLSQIRKETKMLGGSQPNNKEQIRRLFKTSKQVMEEAFQNIRRYQEGEIIPATTGYDYLDKAMLGGFRPQHAIAIGARPSVGKSYVAQKIVETVMNPFVNPQAGDYFLVNCEFEMNPQDILIRRMSREMKMRSIDILKKHTPDRYEEKRMEDVLSKEISDNVIYIDAPCTVKEFEQAVDWIAGRQAHRRMIIFKIDHIALVKRLGSDPKSTIDDTVAVMNEAKLKYPNMFFMIISQFNREIEGRLKNKLEQAPRQSDFYQSDTLGQLCSVMIGLHNPRRYGLNEYMTFNKAWYGSLDRFKTVNKTSFRTEGLLFHHVLKTRFLSLEDLEDTIYPEIMPGKGGLYGEGNATYINPNQPPLPPKEYELLDEQEEISPF